MKAIKMQARTTFGFKHRFWIASMLQQLSDAVVIGYPRLVKET